MGNEKPDLVGLVDPTDDEFTAFAPTETSRGSMVKCQDLEIVWAKMTGYKPLWSPGIVACIFSESVGVIFLDPSANNSQFAWLAPSVKPWAGTHKQIFLKQINAVSAGKRQSSLLEAVIQGDEIVTGRSPIPAPLLRDVEVRAHLCATERTLQLVRPALKLHHLKLFIETNMMELHWRTIAYARQFVKAVPDELFGGFHLVAAQDWPTDREVDSGKVGEVFLTYPGNVLTASEASGSHLCKSRQHSDANRYVAEIPNTAEILDKSGKVNLNFTNKNLFVDGLKYSDPKSPLWAPGPTVNHERTQYCKLQPHHVTGPSALRGFWLQRKRGERIFKDEPLFWSYDCGAGKFDADFDLGVHSPPPLGWRPSHA